MERRSHDGKNSTSCTVERQRKKERQTVERTPQVAKLNVGGKKDVTWKKKRHKLLSRTSGGEKTSHVGKNITSC